jgi:hypothetical protein
MKGHKKNAFCHEKFQLQKKQQFSPPSVALVGFYILFYSKMLNGSEQSSSVV